MGFIEGLAIRKMTTMEKQHEENAMGRFFLHGIE